MEIFLIILLPICFYLIGRWLTKDKRMKEKEGRERYRLEQEELKKKNYSEGSGREKREHKSTWSVIKEYWIAILILLLPILIVLFKYFVLGVRFFGGDGPDQCWGGQSCY